MPAQTAPTGNSRLQSLQCIFKNTQAAAWFGGANAAAQGHNVMKVMLLAPVALHVVGVLCLQFVLRDGTPVRMRRAEG